MRRTFLRRYTDLPALIYLLSHKKITFLDPETWDDRNDSHYLRLYRERKKVQTVLALCFTQASETYHHWRIFAGGSAGACITFKRQELLSALQKEDGLRSGSVEYRKLKGVRRQALAVERLPFLKRYPFEAEREFRIIYESGDNKSYHDVAIPLSCIDKVTLSPWLNQTLFVGVRKALASIKGCGKIRISRSTLISNEEWKALGETATRRRARASR